MKIRKLLLVAPMALMLFGCSKKEQGSKDLIYSQSCKTRVVGIKNKDVEEIIVPNSVTEITEGAFRGCNKLKSIKLPFVGDKRHYFSDPMQYPLGYIFGQEEFAGSIDAYQSYVPVNSTGRTAGRMSIYYLPKTLETVTITDTDYIQAGAFSDCRNIKNVTFESEVKYIGNGAFNDCEKIKVNRYGNGLYLGNGKNDYAYLVGVVDEDIESLEIKDGCELIASFALTELETLTVPDSVKYCNADFRNCIGTLEVNKYENAYYVGNANNPYVILLAATDDDITSCKIHENCKAISSLAFRRCGDIENLYIPKSVKTFGYMCFPRSLPVGSIENVYYGGTLEDWCGITIDSFNNNAASPSPFAPETNFYLTDKSGKVSFDGNNYSLLEGDITIPKSVKEIGPYLFYGYGKITGIKAKDVEEIGDGAFYYSPNLTKLELGNKLTRIGDAAFYRCSSLDTLVVPNSVKHIGMNAFDGFNGSSVTLPTEDLEMTGMIFGPTYDVEKATLYNDCYYVGNKNNPYLMLVGISDEHDDVIEISDKCVFIYSYAGIVYSVRFVIPTSVKYIFEEAFDNPKVYYNGSLDDAFKIKYVISYKASNGVLGKESIISESNFYYLNENGETEFNGKKYSTIGDELIISDNITELSSLLFYKLNGLEKIVIGKNVEKVGYNAFRTGTSAEKVYNLSNLSAITNEKGYSQLCLLTFTTDRIYKSLDE